MYQHAEHLDHARNAEKLKQASIEELKYIIKDASEARDAMPNGPKCGYYADEVHAAAMEIRRRQQANQRMNRARWEQIMLIYLADIVNCTNSDAQGIAEAHEAQVEWAYINGYTPEEAAKLIDKASQC